MWNKLLKFVKYLFLFFLISSLSIGLLAYYNKDKILLAFQNKANDYLQTEVKVDKIDLDFYHRFPQISIQLDNPLIFDAIQGSTDTFLVAKNINLSLDLLELIRGEYSVNRVSIQNARIKIKIDEAGNNNYTIFKSSATEKDTSFKFNLENVLLTNVRIEYIDQRINNNHAVLAKELEASLSVSDERIKIDLLGDLYSEHIGIRGEKYLKQKNVTLDCNLAFLYDSRELIISPSTIKIGTSAFSISGVYINNAHNTTDVHIEGDNTNIQTIVALLPNHIATKLNEYQSEGNVFFSGNIKGNISKTESPQITCDFGFKNASFYHPATKQSIKNATLTGRYTNGEKRNLSTSSIDLKDVSGSIGSGNFSGNFNYRNFESPYLKMNINANLDFSRIMLMYPVKEIASPSGIFRVQANFDGSLYDLRTNTQKVRSSGSFDIQKVDFTWVPNKLKVQNLDGHFLFNNSDLGITEFSGKVGNSDFALSGFFKNFVAYLFVENVNLKMEAGIESNMLDLDELLSSDNTLNTNKKDYLFNLSPKLSFDVDCNVKNLKFRQLTGNNIGKNLVGDLHLYDQKLSFNRIQFDLAGGRINSQGIMNAQDTTNYKAHITGNVETVQVDRFFDIFENFGQTFITEKNLSGTVSAEFDTKLFFNNKLTFNSDKLLADLTISINNGKLMKLEPLEEMGFFMRTKNYDKYLKNSNLSDISFSTLKNSIHIENKKMVIPEMEIKSSSADFSIRGTHSFNNEIDYYVSVPLINYQRRADREDRGIQKNNASGEFYLHMQLVGTLDDFEINIDKKETIESAKEKIGNEIQQLIKRDKEEIDYIQIDIEDTTNMIDFDDL